MAAHSNSTFASAFHVGAVPVPAPDLQPETVSALSRLSACPRLTSDAPRITSAELLALLDPPNTKRRGTIRSLVIRHIPKLDAASGLAPVLI